jgi:MscS family membrane protein
MILKRRAEKTSDLSDDQLVVFFRDFFKVIIVIMGIMMVLNFAFKLNVGSLITGLSIVGAAIALALRESLENLIASFVIFFDKPFTTGDLVKVNNVTGTVEKIGMRSTRIRSDYKTYVSVPNKQMVDSVLDNLSLRTQRRGDIRLELSLQTSHNDVLNIINALKKILTRDKIINFNVLVSEITGQAIVISADYYSINFSLAEFNELKEAVNLDSLKLLETSKVEIAGSSMDVRVKN